jgi:ankyrin repeat protein
MTDDDPRVAGLIRAVRTGDADAVEKALGTGARLDVRDDDDWTALDWAAGTGEPAVVSLLLARGADPNSAGHDQRTPYQIALAAGHVEAARLLREAEERVDPTARDRRTWRPYSRAYQLSQLRRFSGWREPPTGQALSDDEVVFVHDDLTVTAAMWPGEDVVFDDISDAWSLFCMRTLGFRVPDDLDLVPPGPPRAEG